MTMKKHVSWVLASTFLLGACSFPNTPTVEPDFEQSAEADTMEDRTSENDFGFASQTSNPEDNQGENHGKEFKLDRQVTADAISRFAASIQGVDYASAVVTGQEVLISYEVAPDADIDRNEVADQVKRSALSVIPRWFHVYVTDDPSLRINIERLAQTNLTHADMKTSIAATIDLMRESSPQGYPIDDGENANGETKEEEELMNMMKSTELDIAPAAMDFGIEKTADA